MKMATKVIDYKLVNGKKYYKIKWECSWELADNLQHCQELVEQFWEFVDRVKSDDERKSPAVYEESYNQVKNSNKTEVIHVKLENDYDEEVNQPKIIREQYRTTNAILEDDKLMHHKNMNNNAKRKVSITPVIKTPVVRQEDYIFSQEDKSTSCDELIVSAKKTLKNHYLHSDTRNATASNVTSVLCEKRSYDTMSNDSENSNHVEEIDQVRDELTEDIFEPDPNDKVFHWNNPYVRIAFRCRICSEEHLFSDKDGKWKTHFLIHIKGSEQPEEFTRPCSMEDVSQEAIDLIQDPEKPWIQKVEFIIQKWGVNQYFRLLFLCRSCGKEQQPLHTGNWRNHYNSHTHNKPHSCQQCSKMFKSKSYLNQHLKIVHDNVDGLGYRSCFICNKVFNRRLDMRRHIAEVHQIDPANHMNQNEWECEPTIITNQPHDLLNGNDNKREEPLKSVYFAPKSIETLPTFSKVEILKGKKFLQINPNKKEVKKQKKSNVLFNENFLNDKSNFKHVCGICQERFKKKADLKSHTVNIHCIDIGSSTNNVQSSNNGHRETLTPTMVNLVNNTSIRDINGNGSSYNYDRDRTVIGQVKQNNESIQSIIIVKEEIYRENKGNYGNELTIDEGKLF